MKIRLAVSSYDGLRPECARSISRLLALPEFDFDYREIRSCSIVHNRNRLAKDLDADYLLFVDTDVEFQVVAFMQLLAADKDVVFGACPFRDQEFYCAGYRKIPLTETGLHAMDWVGMGFTLIKKAVFERLSYPYFAMPPEAPGEDPLGEDVYFCRQVGKGVYIHCDAKVRHLPREQKVGLPDDDWATVLKAVMAYPLPFERAGELLMKMRMQLLAKKDAN